MPASLRWALLVLAPTGFGATWHFVLAARTVARKCQRAVSYAALSTRDAAGTEKAPFRTRLASLLFIASGRTVCASRRR